MTQPLGAPTFMGFNAKKQKVFLGWKPPRQSQAWWYLPKDAKDVLARMRQQGDTSVGGTPGRAPYWWVVNYGSKNADIPQSNFIENAFARWRPKARAIVRDWIKL